MGIVKLFAAGALGYLTYRAWQRHQENNVSALRDDGGTTPPHGDPVLAGAAIDVEPPPSHGAHSSRGFGEP